MTFAQQHRRIMLLTAGPTEIQLMCFLLALAAVFLLSSAVFLSLLLYSSFLFIQSEECIPPPFTTLIFSDCSPPSWAQVVHRTEREDVNTVNTEAHTACIHKTTLSTAVRLRSRFRCFSLFYNEV